MNLPVLHFISLVSLISASASASTLIVQTSRAGDRLSVIEACPDGTEPTVEITLDPSQEFQSITGFGASFTESSAWNLATLTLTQRNEVLDRLFNPGIGVGFTLTRTHINSCDYSLGHYAYVEKDDLALTSFSIAEDSHGFSGMGNAEVEGIQLEDPSFDLLPMIQAAQSVRGASFKILASPWSPPSWMKAGEHAEMTGGYLRRDQDEAGRMIYWDAWARYLVKYIQTYATAGIPIWGLTPQNEPGHADHARWDSCKWTADEERIFIADYLGPKLVEAGLIDLANLEAGLKLFIFDHNKADLYDFATTVLSDQAAAKFVYGTAFHWYSINYGGQTDYRGDVLDRLAHEFPEKVLLHSESSIDIDSKNPIAQYWDPENRDWTGGRFTPFSQYAIDMITDLNHGAIGYIDWCVVLSQTGGPNPYNNFNSAAVLVNPREQTVLYTPIYYLLGHFSKFVRPGAHRIGEEADLPDGLHSTAFRNTDGSIATVVFNDTEESVTIRLHIGSESIVTSVAGDAIQTILLPAPE